MNTFWQILSLLMFIVLFAVGAGGSVILFVTGSWIRGLIVGVLTLVLAAAAMAYLTKDYGSAPCRRYETTIINGMPYEYCVEYYEPVR